MLRLADPVVPYVPTATQLPLLVQEILASEAVIGLARYAVGVGSVVRVQCPGFPLCTAGTSAGKMVWPPAVTQEVGDTQLTLVLVTVFTP